MNSCESERSHANIIRGMTPVEGRVGPLRSELRTDRQSNVEQIRIAKHKRDTLTLAMRGTQPSR